MGETLGLSTLAANDNSPVDLPLAIVDTVNTTPTLLMVHTDHLGRPTRLTDATKATVWQATYKPWGEVQSMSGTRTQNLRFPGQYFQIETNLAYNHHRHYDPVTGRYTQADPLRFVDGPSIYAYAGNSPFMVTDRDGRFAQIIAGAIIGGGVNAIAQYWATGCIHLSQVGLAAGAGALGVGWGTLVADAGAAAGLGGAAGFAHGVILNGLGNAAIGGGAAAISGGDTVSGAKWGFAGGVFGPLAGAGARGFGAAAGGAIASGAEGVGGAAVGEGGTISGGGNGSGCGCGNGSIFSLW
jgi:RHS repeat-associated protein